MYDNKMFLDDRLDAVYDMTVAYKGGEIAQEEKDILEGRVPAQICFHIRRSANNTLKRMQLGRKHSR